ncbi:MAG: tRNA pseudouridine(38-40) synthase TruA [Candidatus Omnitrophica bacterium]|nr:tRNA pseudouridine(38-40) synthase TruA [Candidatus Omnitrophota bacterium]
MRNLKITLEYDGAGYYGWQVQTRAHNTIQATLEKTLRSILKEKIDLIGSGRTDSGVHALSQVANFKTSSSIPVRRLGLALNALLPHDIVVTSVKQVAHDFHAIRSARSKVYRYFILNRSYSSALLAGRAYFYKLPLDIKLMRKAAAALVGRHDFKAFSASATKAKTTVRTIKKINIKRIPYNPLGLSVKRRERPLIVIDIESEGFLYNMVRNIVGTLIDIGRKRIPAHDIKRILHSKDRGLAGPTAPAQGLFLIKINY